MLRKTHITVAAAVIVPLIIKDPITTIGLIGAVAPDWDVKLGIKHRGLTHSFVTLGLSTLFISNYATNIALAWFLCYLSHLLLDSLTVGGVPFLYPLKTKYKFAKFKTGSYIDNVFQVASILYIAFLLLEMI